MPIRMCSVETCNQEARRRGRCVEHAREHARENSSIGQALYRTKRWYVLARRVKFEQPLCRCGAVAVDVHHIVSLEDGGEPWARSNLEALCKRCHSQETRREQLTKAR